MGGYARDSDGKHDLVTNPSDGFTGWMDATLYFTATGTSELLTLDGEGTCLAGSCGETESGAPPFALIDSVALNAVPEPSTWAMMLLGFPDLATPASGAEDRDVDRFRLTS